MDVFLSFGILVLPHVLSFLIGSLPVGLLLALAQGVDVRRSGSGNIGATNVARVVNNKTGALTLLLDAMKGFVPTALIPYCFVSSSAACGLCVVLGHCYSVFLRGKGGKGVATSLGVFASLAPMNAILATFVFFVIFFMFKYVSLGSVVASITMLMLIFCEWFVGSLSGGEAALTICIALLVIVRHFSNIARLLCGQEAKFSASSSAYLNNSGSDSKGVAVNL